MGESRRASQIVHRRETVRRLDTQRTLVVFTRE
jgi:hypothetical protein